MSKMLSKMNLISVVQQLPKEDIETIQGYVEMIEEENKRLLKTITHNEKCRRKMQKSLMSIIEKQKEVIDKSIDQINDYKIYCEENQQEMNNVLKQEKEFIKYLEDMLDAENDIFSVVRVKDVLSKYKEIIGGD